MYCVNCKKTTNPKKPTIRMEQRKNGRYMNKGECAVCGISRTQFVKKKSWLEKGLGIRKEII